MIAPDLDTAKSQLQDLIHKAGTIVPFTGAGISTECGIPDFRSPGGLWTKNKPIPFDEFLGSQEARNESWRRRFAMADQFGDARPGRGHRALASLYRAGKVPAVITQNIDNLHQASGFSPQHVVELHGNTTYALCLDCNARYELPWVRQRMDAANGCAPDCRLRRLSSRPRRYRSVRPCRMPQCNARQELALACDLFLAIGSSLLVWPAAGFPLLAKRNGAQLASSIARRPSSTKLPILWSVRISARC